MQTCLITVLKLDSLVFMILLVASHQCHTYGFRIGFSLEAVIFIGASSILGIRHSLHLFFFGFDMDSRGIFCSLFALLGGKIRKDLGFFSSSTVAISGNLQKFARFPCPPLVLELWDFGHQPLLSST